MRNARVRGLLAGACLLWIAGCVQVKYDETGVRTKNFGSGKGIVDQDYGPGYHRFLWPLDSWHKFPSTVQSIRFAKEPWGPAVQLGEPLNLTSAGGDKVVMTGQVLFRVTDGQAHLVLQDSGPEQRYKDVVRSLAQDTARVVFGRLGTEDFYNPASREAARQEAVKLLVDRLKQRSIELIDLLVETLEFDPNYENLIKQKKIADQQVELQKAKGKAAEEQGKVEKIKTETTVKVQRIEKETEAKVLQMKTQTDLQIAALQAQANKYATQKQADGSLYDSQQKAEGQRLVKQAEAEGAQRMNEALSGEGGRNLVALEAVQQLNLAEVTFPSLGYEWFNPYEMVRRIGGTEESQASVSAIGAAAAGAAPASATSTRAPAATAPVAAAPASSPSTPTGR